MYVLGNNLGQDMDKTGASIWNGNGFSACKNLTT